MQKLDSKLVDKLGMPSVYAGPAVFQGMVVLARTQLIHRLRAVLWPIKARPTYSQPIDL